MNEKIPFNLIDISRTSTWNLVTATLINTLKEDGGHEKLRDKKDTSIKNENNFFSDIPKELLRFCLALAMKAAKRLLCIANHVTRGDSEGQ